MTSPIDTVLHTCGQVAQTYNQANKFGKAWEKTPEVQLGEKTHTLSKYVGATSISGRNTFVNNTNETQRLGKEHFQEASYQRRVHLPAERTHEGVKLAAGVVSTGISLFGLYKYFFSSTPSREADDEKKRIAYSMIEEGLPTSQISRMTGLSVDEINSLRA